MGGYGEILILFFCKVNDIIIQYSFYQSKTLDTLCYREITKKTSALNKKVKVI